MLSFNMLIYDCWNEPHMRLIVTSYSVYKMIVDSVQCIYVYRSLHIYCLNVRCELIHAPPTLNTQLSFCVFVSLMLSPLIRVVLEYSDLQCEICISLNN